MFADTYTKFYIFMVVALLMGFVSMEIATTGVNLGDLSGMATNTIAGAHPALGAGTPGSNMIFLLIGILAGAALVGTVVYVYKVEKNRMY